MPVTKTHNFAVAPGKSLITMDKWAETLSAEDREAYEASCEVNQKLIKLHEDQGYIISRTEHSVVYSDEVEYLSEQGKFVYVDPVWKVFFDRYQLETGLIYNPTISKS